MYTITLANGAELKNLRLNGNNYIANTVIPNSMFDNNLSTVSISDGDSIQVFYNAELIQNIEHQGESWFILREMSEQELHQKAIFALAQIQAAELSDSQAITVFALYDKWENLVAQHAKAESGLRVNYWLRDVVAASTFAFVNGLGTAAYSGASSSYDVRPAFSIS